MWLVFGALIGAIVGLLSLHEMWVLGGIAGALIGFAFSRRAKKPEYAGEIEDLRARVAALEHALRDLRSDRAPAAKELAAWPEEEPAPMPAAAAPVAEPEPLRESVRCEPAKPHPEPAPMPTLAGDATKLAEMVGIREPSRLWETLFGGNVLAKIGVVLLFLGLASGLKLAIDFGLFPPSVRLLIATVVAVGMIGFGFASMRAEAHRNFGLSLQGGGFAVLYLATYFALSWYRYLDPAAAFAIFAALGIGCMLAAVRFDGAALAILGISGAFAAPVLAFTGEGSHVMLFSYYAVLNLGVIGVNWFRMWRGLNVIGFFFTLVVAMTWASNRFDPEFFESTEAFLALFSLIFSATPFGYALGKGAKLEHWADAVLVSGTPIAAAVAQSWLIEQSGLGDAALAWSAVAAGAYYTALWWCLRAARADDRMRFAHGAIAVPFYTAAVPLAFGVQVTSAFWAIEGLALAWFGLENRGRLALGAGFALQAVAGLYFFAHIGELGRAIPVLNGIYVGALLIALCGAATAWMTYRRIGASTDGTARSWLSAELAGVLSGIACAWALLWWVGSNFAEIDRFAPGRHVSALRAAVFIASAWMLELSGAALGARGSRHAGIVFAAAAMFLGLFDGVFFRGHAPHPLHDGMIMALPAAAASLYLLLRRTERDRLELFAPAAHLFGLWALALLGVMEARWIARELAPAVDLWRLLAWGVVPGALAYAATLMGRHGVWPVAARPGVYLRIGSPVLLGCALAWAVIANFEHSGGGSDLPYIPVASFFDAAQILVILSVLAWMRAAAGSVDAELLWAGRAAASVQGFVWLSAMAMRLAHHWGGVPFSARELFHSGMAQGILSVTWTVMALALMISATRAGIRDRWFMGFALLGIVGAKFITVDVVSKGTVTWTLSLIGVGILILAASYFSPAPPKATGANSA